jgi:hypothetical protein
MSDCNEFAPGGYRYIPAVFQYAGGVAAQPGFAIHRISLYRPLPLAEGFAAIEAHLAAMGRPRTALCGCELRSPAPFNDQGFLSFNQIYVQILQRWGLCRGSDNPVARTNVCPVNDPPAAPALHAFSYTVPQSGTGASFVIAGGGEVPEGMPNYRDYIVCRGDVSAQGLREKMRYTIGQMKTRLAALGLDWREVQATRAYTVHDVGLILWEELAAAGHQPESVDWHRCAPPITDLEFEMDLRTVASERGLAGTPAAT